MMSDGGSAQPVTTRAEPQSFVSDINGSCAFFRKLGFAVEYTHGEPPSYAQVKRDGARINLRRVSPARLEASS